MNSSHSSTNTHLQNKCNSSLFKGPCYRRTYFESNRFKSTLFFESTGSGLVLPRNHVLLSKFVIPEKRSISHKHPAGNYRREQMRATACTVACSPPRSSVFIWRCRLRSYHFQILLSRRRKTLNATLWTAIAMQLSKT